MNCQSELVHAYHDGELSPEQMAAFEAHLNGCADCRELLADLRKISQLVTAAPIADVPQQASRRMQQAWWAAQAARDRGVRRVASWLTAAAAAVILAVMIGSPASRRSAESPVVFLPSDLLVPPTVITDEPQDETIDAAQWIANDLALAMR